jgi:purine-nucleoside phosphorylase
MKSLTPNLIQCGVGLNQVNAAAATQQMLDLFDIQGIVHFGIAGNVNDSLSIGDVSIPKQFAHTGIWDWQVFICLSSLHNFSLFSCFRFGICKSFC